MKSNTYSLLTFYKFVDIEEPMPLVDEHRQFCNDVGLRGRIYIGEEGISATVSGNWGQIKAYRLYLDSIPYFNNIPDIDIKATAVEGHKFDKMIVRYRKEIVALGAVYKATDIENSKVKMPVEKFKEILDAGDESYVILDMRNNYEYKLGHFKNAIPAGTFHFRELDKLLSDYREKYKDKKMIMYCTGGIRCEKAAVMLERSGLEGVWQVDGGVVKYVNTYDDGNWLGNLYTFDNRISTVVGEGDTHFVISRCHYSGEPAETFFNCRFSDCNAQIIAKEEEYRKHFGFCSQQCLEDAMETLRIRNNFKIDDYNYKELRGRIKAKPELRDSIAEKIRKHVLHHIGDLKFKHQLPANENELN